MRISTGLGLTAALALTVAWLLPPTTPKAPAAASEWRALARTRSAAGTQPLPAPAAATAAAPSPTAPLAAAIAEQARASVRDAGLSLARQAGLVVDRDVLAADDRPTDTRAERFAQARAAAAPRARPAAMAIDPAEARYRSGYAWARDNGVEDPRDCRPWRDDPATDGCLDYLDDDGRGGSGDRGRDPGW